MAEQEPMDSPGRQEPLQPKPGGLLREAREARGLSLDEMVVQTKLPRSMLDAIEGDNFELLSEPVYVRGYYRKYARVVGADEAAVIAGYEAHAGGQLPKLEVPVLLQDEPIRERRRLPLLLLLLVVIIAVVAAAWWWLSSGPETVSSNTSSVRPAAARVTEPPAERGGQAVDESTSSRPSTGERSATSVGGPRRLALETTMTSAPTASEPAETPDEAEATPATETPAATAAEVLVLEFNDASWVRVEDGSGRRVLNGLIQSGETRSIDDEGPFSIFLGYAPGVDVTFRGETVDVSQYVRGNNTARFTVE